jgi:transposase-like protein
MELQKATHQFKLEQWRKIVAECRSSSLTVKEWCRENGISLQTYYRWQKQVWDSGMQNCEVTLPRANEIQFAEYPTPMSITSGNTAVILRFGEFTAEIQNGAAPEAIESTILALKKLC